MVCPGPDRHGNHALLAPGSWRGLSAPGGGYQKYQIDGAGRSWRVCGLTACVYSLASSPTSVQWRRVVSLGGPSGLLVTVRGLALTAGAIPSAADLKLSDRADSGLKLSSRADADLKLSDRADSGLKLSSRADADLKLSDRADAGLKLSSRADAGLKLSSRAEVDCNFMIAHTVDAWRIVCQPGASIYIYIYARREPTRAP